MKDISTAPKTGVAILGLWGEFIFPTAWIDETETETVKRGIWPFQKIETVETRIAKWVPVIPCNGKAAVFWARMPTAQPTHWIGMDCFYAIEAADDAP